MHEAWPEGRHARMSHPGPIFSRSIFDGGSDARTALDDAVRHGNNPYRCACTGSDVRSTLPGLHAGLQQRRQLHRVWLILDNRWNKLFEDKELKQFKPLFVVKRNGVKLLSKMFRLSDGKIVAPGTSPTSRAPVSNLKKN